MQYDFHRSESPSPLSLLPRNLSALWDCPVPLPHMTGPCPYHGSFLTGLHSPHVKPTFAFAKVAFKFTIEAVFTMASSASATLSFLSQGASAQTACGGSSCRVATSGLGRLQSGPCWAVPPETHHQGPRSAGDVCLGQLLPSVHFLLLLGLSHSQCFFRALTISLSEGILVLVFLIATFSPTILLFCEGYCQSSEKG